MIEGEDARAPGGEQVQGLGDDGHRRIVDIAEGLLHRMEDRQEGARLIAMGRNQPLKLGFLREGLFWHAISLAGAGRRGVGRKEIASSLDSLKLLILMI